MKLVLYTASVSPHQLPLAKELEKIIGGDNFRAVYHHHMNRNRVDLGWNPNPTEEWELILPDHVQECRDMIENSDVLLCGVRDVDLFERRSRRGLTTAYCCERWFKPPFGMLRLLHPAYFMMTFRFMRLVKRGVLVYLPIGIFAARDMARLFGLFSGDLRCLLRTPQLAFDPRPMGAVKECPWMRMWGYFVAPSQGMLPGEKTKTTTVRALRVLWVGRLLAWKRVDTLLKAVFAVARRRSITLTIVGRGPEREALQRLEKRLCSHVGFVSPVSWHDAVPISEVRVLMRQHDVYVLSSNGYEGWGAVVSEAIEEGMHVIGTYEAGASATILPDSCLYHAGDVNRLAELLMRTETEHIACVGKERWSAASAAECFVRLVSEGEW